MWFAIGFGIGFTVIWYLNRRLQARSADMGSVSKQWVSEHQVATGHEHSWLTKRDR